MHHHGAGLRRLLAKKGIEQEEQDALLSALTGDYHTARVSSADRAMLEYVIKLTRAPSSIEAEDVDELRAGGFDDRAVHDICAIGAYYAFVNRIADGLGVELEGDRAEASTSDGETPK